MLQNVSSVAVVVGALRAKYCATKQVKNTTPTKQWNENQQQ